MIISVMTAFIQIPIVQAPKTQRAPKFVCCHGGGPAVSRRQILTALSTSAVASLMSMVPQSSVSAADTAEFEEAISKTLFPKPGINSPDTVVPAGVNEDVLSTPEAKAALEQLRKFDQGIKELYSKFKENPQLEISSTVKDLLPINELRSALNSVNEAIDESAQVASDKVVRGIIQDIGELETASALKQGISRTKKRIAKTTDWFDKLTADFQKLLSYYAD